MSVRLEELSLKAHAAVIVTFHPDVALVQRQLRQLSAVSQIVIVDNGSPDEHRASLRRLVDEHANAELLLLASNEGLAAGLNAGMARAADLGARSVLLLDQDSLFESEVPALLLDSLNRLQAETGTLCCVGPSLRDPQSNMSHGFHYIANGWRWARAFPARSDPPFPTASLNGSGTTMSMGIVNALGALDASLFIDHVDTEWSFRVLDRGFGLFGVPGVEFEHHMGEGGRRLWLLGWRVWPERSPLRHYYLYRNTMHLLRRPYVPFVWKVWAVGKLVASAVIVALTDSRRKDQVGMMIKGVAEGLRGNSR